MEEGGKWRWREEVAPSEVPYIQVVTSKGSLKCRILISAVGALHKPSLPDLPGTQDFKGGRS